MSVFVDTPAFLAILDEDDKQHLPAQKTWKRLIEDDEQIICSSYVLVETIALIQRRLGIEAVKQFHAKVFPLIKVVWIDGTHHQSGMSTVLESDRRKLSLVDCTSFAVMKTHHIHSVFCFDPHFSEQGFEVLK